MRPGQVLDSRADLLNRLRNDWKFRDQCTFLLASQIGDISASPEGVSEAEKRRAIEKHGKTTESLANHLTVAEAYRVTEAMSEMVQFAASELDGLDRIDQSLAPTQTGFVRFDKPLPVLDIRGRTMLIHWLTWGPYMARDGRTCTVVWAFNDPKTDPDETHEEILRIAGSDESVKDGAEFYERFVGRFATVGVDFLFNDQRIGPKMANASSRQIAEVLAEGVKPLPGTNTMRYIHALWLLLNQTITKVAPEEVDRPARRRAGKAKLPPRVSVIKLRREETLYRQPGESQVEWQHRWIVRGHRRWQPCGPEHPLAQEVEPGVFRARIWIHPYVKGPEDKPFVQSEKLYDLSR